MGKDEELPKISNKDLKIGLLKGAGYCCLVIFALGIFSIVLTIYVVILAVQAYAIIDVTFTVGFIVGRLLASLLFFAGGVYLCARAKEKWAMRIKKKFGRVKWDMYD